MEENKIDFWVLLLSARLMLKKSNLLKGPTRHGATLVNDWKKQANIPLEGWVAEPETDFVHIQLCATACHNLGASARCKPLGVALVVRWGGALLLLGLAFLAAPALRDQVGNEDIHRSVLSVEPVESRPAHWALWPRG